jgi:hypothetical protein
VAVLRHNRGATEAILEGKLGMPWVAIRSKREDPEDFSSHQVTSPKCSKFLRSQGLPWVAIPGYPRLTLHQPRKFPSGTSTSSLPKYHRQSRHMHLRSDMGQEVFLIAKWLFFFDIFCDHSGHYVTKCYEIKLKRNANPIQLKTPAQALWPWL